MSEARQTDEEPGELTGLLAQLEEIAGNFRESIAGETRLSAMLPDDQPSRRSDAAAESPADDDEAWFDDEFDDVEAPADEAATAKAVAVQGRSRSAFAPDPVRQRTYVDLRDPPRLTSGAPELPVRARRHDVGGSRRTGTFEDDLGVAAVAAALAPTATDAADKRAARGLDARTLAFAALFGVVLGGIGLGLAVGFGGNGGETGAPVVAALDEPVEAAAIPESTEPDKDQSRLDAVAAAPPPPEPDREIAVADPEPAPAPPAPEIVPQETDLAAAAADALPEEPESAPVADVPADEPPAARVADTEPASPGDGGLLAYAPTRSSVDPTVRSIRTPADESTGPAENRGPGTARTTVAVNLRGTPDNDGPVVAVVPAGSLVDIERCVFWCEVRAGDKTGYIYRKFVGR